MDVRFNTEALVEEIIAVITSGSVEDAYRGLVNGIRIRLSRIPDTEQVLRLTKPELEICLRYLQRQDRLSGELMERALNLYILAYLMHNNRRQNV